METKYFKAQYSVWSPYLLVLKCVNYGDQKIVSYKGFKHHYKKERIIYLYHQMSVCILGFFFFVERVYVY